MESGVQSRHDQVDQKVDQDETEGGDHHHRLWYGDILVIDRLLGQLAEAAAAEDGLGDQRPGNQFAEQQPGNIQRRQQGIPITWRQRTPVSLMPLARATATKG